MLTSFADLFEKYAIRPNGILHLGASDDGKELPHYAKACPTGPILLCEALPKVCARLAAKLTHPNMRAICACISDKDGEEREFFVANNAGMSSSLLAFGTHTVQHPTVKNIGSVKVITTRVDTLINRELGKPIDEHTREVTIKGPWFANIDIQGAELLALRGMEKILPAFGWLYIEVNRGPTYIGCPMVEELDAFLAPHGFERKETWWWKPDASWGDGLWVRKNL